MSKSGVRAFLIKELKEVLPPTLFFATSFNLLVLTINLILADYLASFVSFLVATTAALVVGKSVLVADAMPFLRRFSGAVPRKARRVFVCRRNLRRNPEVCDDSLHLAPLCGYTDLDLRSVSDLYLG